MNVCMAINIMSGEIMNYLGVYGGMFSRENFLFLELGKAISRL